MSLHPDRSLGWVRRIWPVVARQRRIYTISIVVGLLGTIATVTVPVAVGRGVDAIAASTAAVHTTEPTSGTAGVSSQVWATVIIVLAATHFGFGFAYRYGLFRSSHRVEADLRNLLFERLTELSFAYWDRVQTGQVISRANSDVRSIQLLFAFLPITAVQLVRLVMGVAAMLILSPRMALAALVPLPVVFYLGRKLRDTLFPMSWVVQARMAEVTTITDENIQGMQVVRTFGRERDQVALLARAAQRLCWAGCGVSDARARHAPVMEAMPRLSLALVLFIGGMLAIDDHVGVGDIVAFNAYVVIVAGPISFIGFVMVQWQRASAAAVRVFEILDEEPTIQDIPDARALASPQGRVTLDGVVFSYPSGDGEPVLNGCTIEIEPGETVAVVGRTGSGKSTIARLLPRFYDVDGGAVCIDGTDVRRIRLNDLRRAVAVVPEEPFLFAGSIRDNVAYARADSDDTVVQDALADAAAEDFISALPHGVHSELEERGSNVSGGQRQRIAIARVLLADPAVLVLDDATSAVDAEVEERILTALRRRRAGRTTIIIAHRLSTIIQADRVVFIEAGRVAAEGDHATLLRDVPEYAETLISLRDRRYSSGDDRVNATGTRASGLSQDETDKAKL